MKELVKNSRVTGYLEKIYRQLNIDKFGGELEDAVITVQSSKNSYGHITCGRVWKVKDSAKYELNISADYLIRPIENVAATMLHEMVHIYNLMHDIQDCSRGNTYHNKKFRDKAQEVGLIIEHDKRIGWSITSPSEELLEYIITQGWTDIFMNRGSNGGYSAGGSTPKAGNAGDGNGNMKKPSSTRKYKCPCCGNSVRATKAVNIICGDCAEQMQLEM